jgi:uncharacterized phage protein (TIGR01671 family)
MREHLYRGKHKETGEWVFGFIMMPVNRPHIEYCIQAIVPDENSMRCFCEVIPETIGEFIGLLDRNGMKIFEGDIVKTDYFDTPAAVCFIRSAFVTSGMFLSETHDETMIIIGNIHDNPELLQGETA